MKIKLLFILVFLMGTFCFPQKYLERQLQGNISQDQIVSLSSNLTFQQAIELLSKVSEKVKGKNETVSPQRTEATYASVDSREVKISAVFFEADLNAEKQLGVDWQILLSKNSLSVGGKGGNPIQSTTTTGTTTTTATQGYQLNATTNFDLGGFFGNATAIFRAFETKNIGEIIASPNITTRDRVKGRIQVGTDFSIKQKDFAGNVIESFFSTGAIVEVTPYVYKEDGVDYILLSIGVERSSFTPD